MIENQIKKYYILPFGCQANIADSERIKSVLRQCDFIETANMDEADIITVVACSIRQHAIDRIFGLKPRFDAMRKERDLLTLLSGCVLEDDKPRMQKMFDVVFPIKELPDLPKKINAAKKNLVIRDYQNINPDYNSKFQAFLPIMNGCNQFCTFCVVPYTRGREESRPVKDILHEFQALIQRGYKEITLIGQTVNHYLVREEGKIYDFADLITWLDKTPGNYWIRYASSHPLHFTDKVINAVAKAKHTTPYLHLPVQSGDNQMLKRMKRVYSIEQYIDIVFKMRAAIPNLMLSTDVIVGFCGETENEFQNTVKLFKELEFDMAYLAQYSNRQGTYASKHMPDDVPKAVKAKRFKILTDVLRQTSSKNNKQQVGKTFEVLVEKVGEDGLLFGHTDTFKNIKFAGSPNLVGQFVDVKVTTASDWSLGGELEDGKLKVKKSYKVKLAV
ncbi:MAG: tRNA (N6-isopentenyl adenosine(37)-C2)-methylthiotransferase MiaB [Candidatus Buchananbacteria bacterium CG10_big_fil_rev_8_21_14_0_10_42_9]|uniref:tRNA-2-methylthio-N(6)-dimethylallyladenosine synthase n=1 Tax=Candidatus Buchananbacteria bacterium CG10_big_fil_rev_8_21_14_0_10_42_9 TaxID=1974526 RepID=A0A2H0W2V4_9BACT|nr:MAG: tRNA (N6-isopentenyl adenosine(37)-C2)-methylthiotransferase MiaB [Candidatus Buchananbacteria bacterium CG10_big_fil_rev_8_21_14_0_10_42_9]